MSGSQGYFNVISGSAGLTYRRKPRLYPDDTDSTGPR